MKRILAISFTILLTVKGYSNDNQLLIFKLNENLKYKIQIHPMPDEFAYSVTHKLTNSITEYNLVKFTIKENDNNTYKLLFNLKMLEKKSCCNPLTYPGYVYTIDSDIENIIKPSGEFIENQNDYISLGCIFGFNIVKLNHNKSKKGKPIIIPFYFSEKEISIGESWMCKFELNEKADSNILLINYTLKNITDNIAYIEGFSKDGLHVASTFDIVKGCWIDYKMYYKKDSKEYLWKSFELIK